MKSEGNKHTEPSYENQPILIIQSISPRRFEEESKQRLNEAMDGKQVPHVINFEDPKTLRKILTDRRLDLIEKIREESPNSIRDLARKVNRGLREIHEDLNLLAEYEIVKFVEDGRAKRPVVPYDQIKIEADLLKQPNKVSDQQQEYSSADDGNRDGSNEVENNERNERNKD